MGEQLQSIGIEPGPILIEPEGRNTAPAILAASIFAFNRDKDSILLVAPSDHVIPDKNAFYKAVSIGQDAISQGKIVTFGITPTHPEIGYGYLKLSKASFEGAVDLAGFIEKPDKARAKEMLDAGSYLWNAGIFMFRAADMIEAFKLYSPEMLSLVHKSVFSGEKDLDFFRLGQNFGCSVRMFRSTMRSWRGQKTWLWSHFHQVGLIWGDGMQSCRKCSEMKRELLNRPTRLLLTVRIRFYVLRAVNWSSLVLA